jgi:hypothetical protein
VWRGAGHLQGARQRKIVVVRNLSGDATGTVLIIALKRIETVIAKLGDQLSILQQLFHVCISIASFAQRSVSEVVQYYHRAVSLRYQRVCRSSRIICLPQRL